MIAASPSVPVLPAEPAGTCYQKHRGLNPASGVIDKCGGVRRVAEWTGRSVSRVYRWTYPKTAGGTGGLVPSECQALILRRARHEGVDLVPDDCFSIGTREDTA